MIREILVVTALIWFPVNSGAEETLTLRQTLRTDIFDKVLRDSAINLLTLIEDERPHELKEEITRQSLIVRREFLFLKDVYSEDEWAKAEDQIDELLLYASQITERNIELTSGSAQGRVVATSQKGD